MRRHLSVVMFACLAALVGCAAEPPVGTSATGDSPADFLDPLDLADESDKSSTFSQHNVIDDATFTDVNSLTADQVQAFLENTPYNKRSFLADEYTDGVLVSQAIVDAAREEGISPLVILATAQKEQGFISRTDRPSQAKINKAFGCGCPDNQDCSAAYRGMAKQLACAANVLGKAFREAGTASGTTAGYRIGERIRTLDPSNVYPENAATVSLYNYTPWVQHNKLFHNIFNLYADHEGYSATPSGPRPFNQGFIGSECASAADCNFDGAICMATDGGSFCTKPCDRLCPDRSGSTTTLCADFGGEGYCVAGCPSGGSCPGEMACTSIARFGDTSTSRDVCYAPVSEPAGPPAPRAEEVLLSVSGVLREDGLDYHEVIPPIGGTIRIAMNAVGDPDLYVGEGFEPTTDMWTCRPYEGADRSEECLVESTGARLYIQVRSYGGPSEYELTVSVAR